MSKIKNKATDFDNYFSKVGQNKVKVSLGKGKWNKQSSVTYILKCNGNDCKVSDVIDSSGSLKKNILAEC